MSFLWFGVALIFLCLWLDARSKSKSTQQSADYGQGYWDGYRAFGAKVAELLQSDTLSKNSLRRLVDEGNGIVRDEAEQPARREELGIIPEGIDEYDDENATQPVAIPVAIPQPVLSEADIAADKQKQTLQNLNILLYVASFLIVAAAALFVTLVMPAGVKLFSLIFVTVAFYGGGLVLYGSSERLRPAAVAFVGTGLAILPFIGFALTSLGGLSGETAWLLTSLVGLIAYGYAAVRLQSELVSYLTMAFVLSLALSAVSTLSLSIVWYFIVTIGVSLVCNSVHILWPKLLPAVFAKPVEQTGQLTTPVALVASLLVASEMDIFMYEVLYGIATAHYLVVWLEKRALFYEMIVRVLAHVTLLLVAADVTNLAVGSREATTWFGAWILGLAILQLAYSLVRIRPSGDVEAVQLERVFVAGSLTLMCVSMFFWMGDEHEAWWTAGSLACLGLAALGTTLRLREAGWAYVGLAASALLPYVIGRSVVQPPISYEVLAGCFTLLGIFALMGLERARTLGRSRSVQTMLSVSVTVYALLVALSGVSSYESITIAWTALLTAGLFVGLSYLVRAPALELVGALFVVASVAAWVYGSSVPEEWQWFTGITVSAALLGVGAWVHHFNREAPRRNLLACAATGILAFLLFAAMDTDIAIVRAATLVLLVAGMGGLALRLVVRPQTILRLLAQLAYFGYPVLALAVAWQAGVGWVTLVLAVITGVLWVGSYIEKMPVLLVAGNLAFVATVNALWYWLEFDSSWQLYGTAWISAAVFYGVYWLMVDRKDALRQGVSLLSVFVVLGFATAGGLLANETEFILAAVGSLFAGSVVLAIQGYLEGKRDYIEVAVYVGTCALQRMVSVLIPETNLVVYGHWWAIVIALMAWWRNDNYKPRAIVALGFVTGSTGIYALMGEEGYSMLFLVEHLLVLIAGAALRKAWAMWWGVIAVVLAVLYFLRDYTFLAPLFLGILLIIFVVWRLAKMGKK